MNTLKITNPPKLDYYGRESMNTICSNITFAGNNIHKVLITSCTMAEGKTTMAMRIAVNMAGRGKKVLFIDCDLRKSIVMSAFGVETEEKVKGIAHYLNGMEKMEDVVYSTDIENLYVLPAGRDVVNPLPLLDSEEMRCLLSELEKEYDLILIDTPPVGMVVDAAEIAKYCDGIIFVVEYGKRHKGELIGAVKQLNQSGCPILGCVIDKVTVKSLVEKTYYKNHYYHGYGYGYGYGYYNKNKSDANP